MKMQVLVSAMHQTDHSLLDKMNIQTDAIIINQCDRNEIEEFEYKGNSIKFLSLKERGVGLSRNNALMRATAEICLFSDEDTSYVENYAEIISRSFEEQPDADIIVLNVPSTNPDRPVYIIPKPSRVRLYNCLKYGAVKIAVRTESLRRANVYFSLLFGGGAKYCAGEDSLFLAECLKKGLKVYANPSVIGYVKQDSSSWFKGYDDKYYMDKGVFFAFLSKKWAKLLCLQYVIRHKKEVEIYKPWPKVYGLMVRGAKNINTKD
jgi:hypothetical protein